MAERWIEGRRGRKWRVGEGGREAGREANSGELYKRESWRSNSGARSGWLAEAEVMAAAVLVGDSRSRMMTKGNTAMAAATAAKANRQPAQLQQENLSLLSSYIT